MRNIFPLTILVAALTFAAPKSSLAESPGDGLKIFCVSCHGPQKRKGGVRLDELPSDPTVRASLIRLAIEQIDSREMPPEDALTPTAHFRSKLARHLRGMLEPEKTSLSAGPRKKSLAEIRFDLLDILKIPSELVETSFSRMPAETRGTGFSKFAENAVITAEGLEFLRLAFKDLFTRVLQMDSTNKRLSVDIPLTETFVRFNEKMRDEFLASSRSPGLRPVEKKRYLALARQRSEWIEGDLQWYERHRTFRPMFVRPWILDRPLSYLRENNEPRAIVLLGKEDGPKIMHDGYGRSVENMFDAYVGPYNMGTSVKFPASGMYRLRIWAAGRDVAFRPLSLVVKAGAPGATTYKEISRFTVEAPLEAIDENAKDGQFIMESGERLLWFLDDRTAVAKIVRGESGDLFVSRVQIDGPMDASWPPSYAHLLFPPDMAEALNVGNYEAWSASVRTTLRGIAHRLWQREPSEKEIAPLIRAATFDVKDSVLARDRDKVLAALATVMADATAVPEFILTNKGEGDSVCVAEQRVKNALWMASSGEPCNSATNEKKPGSRLSKQRIKQIISDPRTNRFIEDFTDEWLLLHELRRRAPSIELYPEFDESLRESMIEETLAFMRYCFLENRPIGDLVESDYVWINDRLAYHYGIPGIRGANLRKVPLPRGSLRGGILGQASFLAVTSMDTRTSPVSRGAFVVSRILGSRPLVPPPNVPELSAVTVPNATARQKLQMHLSNADCAVCHKRIDPIGFSLEPFDAIGRVRPDDGKTIRGGGWQSGSPFVTAGVLSRSKAAFDDVRELKTRLKQHHMQDLRIAFLSNLTAYLTAAPLSADAHLAIEDMARRLGTAGDGVQDALLLVLSSRIFLQAPKIDHGRTEGNR
jgi:Protein of unknown function (DUF1588)/Protein of unknown function (DUF1592)/Planctomycete cytochrome C